MEELQTPELFIKLIINKMDKIKNAFTLLELLVVIGIIGILVALATVSYSATQKSGRDSRRKQDLVAMQNALEQYYSANSYKYPATCSTAASYLKSSWPVDPINDATYKYVEDTTCATTTSYCICALMEKDTSGNSGSGCTWAGKTHYCVANLQ